MKSLFFLLVVLLVAQAKKSQGDKIAEAQKIFDEVSREVAQVQNIYDAKKLEVKTMKKRESLNPAEQQLLEQLKNQRDVTLLDLEKVTSKLQSAEKTLSKAKKNVPSLHGNVPRTSEQVKQAREEIKEKRQAFDASRGSPRTIVKHNEFPEEQLKTHGHQREDRRRAMEELKEHYHKKAEAHKWSVKHGHPFAGKVKPTVNPSSKRAAAAKKRGILPVGSNDPSALHMPDLSKLGTTYEPFSFRHFLHDKRDPTVHKVETATSFGCGARCAHSDSCHSWTWFHNITTCVMSLGRPGQRRQAGVPDHPDGKKFKSVVFSGIKESDKGLKRSEPKEAAKSQTMDEKYKLAVKEAKARTKHAKKVAFKEGTPIAGPKPKFGPDMSKLGTTFEPFHYRHYAKEKYNRDDKTTKRFETESSLGCASRCGNSPNCNSWTWFHNSTTCVTSTSRPSVHRQKGLPEHPDGAVDKPKMFTGVKESKKSKHH